VEGPQYAPGGGMPSILGDTSPDLWGRLLLERREAIAAKQEGRRRVGSVIGSSSLAWPTETRMGHSGSAAASKARSSIIAIRPFRR